MTVICTRRDHVTSKRPFWIAATMGCGHSKINIYPRKSKTKHGSSKKSVTVAAEKAESEEEDGIENESENSEHLEDCDKKTIKVKPFGGPLLAQTDISTSQQDFFKMLEEKIENGPDYNSESESERMGENARLRALMKDWETASAGSRSLPSTPKRRSGRGSEAQPQLARVVNDTRGYTNISQISQSVVHQSYGVSPHQQQQLSYRQVPYNSPPYPAPSPPHAALPAAYPSALQYQAISPLYSPYPPAPARPYPSYNQYGSPIKTYSSSAGGSPKHHHIPPSGYDQQFAYASPPGHKMYGGAAVATAVPVYSNGELIQQQYNQQIQYQQYKEAREQILIQNQQPQPGAYRQPPRSYQTTVTIPIVVKSNDVNRKQYELT